MKDQHHNTHYSDPENYDVEHTEIHRNVGDLKQNVPYYLRSYSNFSLVLSCTGHGPEEIEFLISFKAETPRCSGL